MQFDLKKMVEILNPLERQSIIITLEGGEGSGKTTLEKRLRKRLEDEKFRVHPKLKEPGSTPRAELIRIALKNAIDSEYDFPSRFKERFNLEEFVDKVISEPLPHYAATAVGIVMSFLPDEGAKYGLLEFCLNPERRNLRTNFYRSPEKEKRGEDTYSNYLFRLITKLNDEIKIEMGSKSVAETVLVEHLATDRLSAEQQARLFLAARNLLYHNVIGPAMHRDYTFDGKTHKISNELGKYDILINDRSGDSSVVYQGHAQAPNRVEEIRASNLEAMEGIIPDLTLFLDIDPEKGLERTRKNDRGITGKDFFDEKEMAFHYAIRNGYRTEQAHYADLDPKEFQYRRIVTIDASRNPEEVEQQAWKIIEERLGKKITHIRKTRQTNR